MDGRRGRKRDEKALELQKAQQEEKVNIKSKFVDAKKNLANVSRLEWESFTRGS
jgi:hypothetical protein